MPVFNKYKNPPSNSIYIGRGSKWGNPFVIGKDGDRNAVCDKHKQYLWKQINSEKIDLVELASLHDKNLVCFCAPLRCHGDELLKAAKWAKETLDEQEGII